MLTTEIEIQRQPSGELGSLQGPGLVCGGTQPRSVSFSNYFVHHRRSHRASVFNVIIPNHSAKSPFRRERYKEEDQRQDIGRIIRTKRGSGKPNHGEICTSPLFCDGKGKNFHNLMSPGLPPIPCEIWTKPPQPGAPLFCITPRSCGKGCPAVPRKRPHFTAPGGKALVGRGP